MLATRFAHSRNQIQSTNPLSDDALRQYIPSMFAVEAHDSRSARYTYVPTIDVVSALRREGFEPFFACQAKSRTEGKSEFTKHMLRMRHASNLDQAEVPEVILVNSHDGTTSYQMLAGMFRFLCCNGMVVGSGIQEVRVQHKGNIIGQVIEGAYTVLDEFGRVRESADAMKQITLTDFEQSAFGRAALVAKYGEADAYPITEAQIIAPRRSEDRGPDLWKTFNRVQENAVRGGLRGVNANGQRRRTREVRGIGENVQLNRALWTLAAEMARIKSA